MQNTRRYTFRKALFRRALISIALVILMGAGNLRAAADGDSAANTPWYHNVSTIIALAALMFSFGTTAVSARRAELQDVQASRQELRGILQRLNAIPREMMEAAKKHAMDPGLINGLSQAYNQESTMLSRQAAEIVKRLPSKVVSATECYAIAVAFQTSYNLASAKEFLGLALAKANNFNDEIGALRSSAFLDFLMGQPQEGRVKYQRALAIFTKYPNYDAYTVASTHILTELLWGGSEAMILQYQAAMQHADNAEGIAEGLPPGMGSDNLRGQIQQAREEFLRASSGNRAAARPAAAQNWAPHPLSGNLPPGLG